MMTRSKARRRHGRAAILFRLLYDQRERSRLRFKAKAFRQFHFSLCHDRAGMAYFHAMTYIPTNKAA